LLESVDKATFERMERKEGNQFSLGLKSALVFMPKIPKCLKSAFAEGCCLGSFNIKVMTKKKCRILDARTKNLIIIGWWDW
jgi:hypothetical protein